jgi:UPF0271 protein
MSGKTIDLNCDMGEIPEDVFGGAQESLMPFLSSVNVACGGHAGDEKTMRATIEQALRHNLAIGAHPGYPDRVHFGRFELRISPAEISDFVFEQVEMLAAIAGARGANVTHVKAHGALYNQAAREPAIAEAIAAGVARWSRDVRLVGLAGSRMLDVFRNAGFAVAAEAFADRRYEPDGGLRSRKLPDALVSDPAEAAKQAVRIAEDGTAIASDGSSLAISAQTICIHGDNPGSADVASAVAQALRRAGLSLAPLSYA